MKTVVYLDSFGVIVEKSAAKFKAVLQGSYEYCFSNNKWKYKVESIEPPFPISYVFSDEMLFREQQVAASVPYLDRNYGIENLTRSNTYLTDAGKIVR